MLSTPPLPAMNDVFHHIKTSGPPIFSKSRRIDEEKLRPAKMEFEQLEKEGLGAPLRQPLGIAAAYGTEGG